VSWWYLSYASDAKGFRGGVVVEAETFEGACLISRLRRLSPGGVESPQLIPPERFRNRLLSKAQVKEMWPDGIRR